MKKRRKYNKNETPHTIYQLVLEKRDKWIYSLDKVLSNLDLEESLWTRCKQKEKCSSRMKGLLKAKFHKQTVIKELLREQEKKDPFGYKSLRKQAKREKRKIRNPYILNDSTMKSLLNDIRREARSASSS